LGAYFKIETGIAVSELVNIDYQVAPNNMDIRHHCSHGKINQNNSYLSPFKDIEMIYRRRKFNTFFL